MPMRTDSYGLMIERTCRYGGEYVEVHVVRRSNDNKPLGVSGDGEIFQGYGCPNHLLGLVLDGLGMYGFVSDSRLPEDTRFIGDEVRYQNVYSMNERKLERMLKAIKRVNAKIEKDQAVEAGDRLVSFAKALKLEFVCVRRTRTNEMAWNEAAWNFVSVERGRELYRDMIKAAIAETLARKVA